MVQSLKVRYTSLAYNFSLTDPAITVRCESHGNLRLANMGSPRLCLSAATCLTWNKFGLGPDNLTMREEHVFLLGSCFECLTGVLSWHLVGQSGNANAHRVVPLRPFVGPLHELLGGTLNMT